MATLTDTEALEWAAEAFRDSRLNDRYKRFRRYASGDQDLAFATPKYAATFGKLFAAFQYNRMEGVIDAHADRLQVERFTAEQEAVAELAGELWARNRMDQRAGEVHKEALTTGDAYVIVWPETGEALGEDAALPQLWPQRAEQVRVRYDEERPGQIILAAKTWTLGDGRRRINLYFPDRIEKYVTSSRGAGGLPTSAAGLERVAIDGEAWPVPNPWGVVPVIHFANNAGTGQSGTSELRDVMPLQDALNKVLTDLILACELAGFPQKVILGLDSGDPAVREGLQRLEAGLNKIFTIPFDGGGEAPSIAEFSAANLPQLVAVVELFDKLISRVSRVPVHYLQMSGDFPSGRALRTAEAPFVSKIEDRQVAYGNAWEDVMGLALRQAGIADPGTLSTVWKSAAPLSQEDAWDLAQIKAGIGLPLPQILRETGYTEGQIEQIQSERETQQESATAQFARAFNAGAA